MSNKKTDTGYHFKNEEAEHTHAYLWGTVCEIMGTRTAKRVFDLGCGNGAFASHLKKKGYEVTGVDPSSEGIEISKKTDPSLRLDIGSAYDPLSESYGTFPIVISLEVVEHVYYPRKFANCVSNLLEPGGMAIVSTPYHGYLKNLALALSGATDRHHTALWDDGHIKFWSIKTLTELFAEQGLTPGIVKRVGRIPSLAKSMILTFHK